MYLVFVVVRILNWCGMCSREELVKKLTEAFNVADVVVTSGGVSMGEMVSTIRNITQ